MRSLVTGGFGFDEYAVTRALAAAGHDVTVLGRSIPPDPPVPDGVEVVRADIREHAQLQDALAGRSFDGVCHLAGLARVRDSFEHPLDYFETNVGGTANLLRVLSESDRPPRAFVLASTGAVYGSSASGAVDENAPPLPG